ncbi:MAG: FAD-binding oxidoreductase [Rhodospirillaceae bacterium]
MRRRELIKNAIGIAITSSLTSAKAWAQDIRAVTLDGGHTTLTKADINSFAAELNGIVLLPDSTGYNIARELWNKYWDRRPALIVKCNGVQDVVTAVNFGRENNLLTAVRCGGHSMSGKSMCDGGLVIDLAAMNDVQVDVRNRVAMVEGGALLGNLDSKALPLGLGTTAGVVSHTGAGGLILGGGMGRLQRRFGLAIDNNIGAEIVTAEGKVLRASADENPDLYWGVRGGGGNFGVATKLFMRLHPMEQTVLNFVFVFPSNAIKDALKLYFDFALEAPENTFTMAGASIDPEGNRSAYISGNYFGSFNEIDELLRPIRSLGTAAVDRVYPMKYVDVQRSIDDGINEPGRRRYAKGGFLRDIKPGLIETLIDGLEPLPTRRLGIGLLPMDGAPARIGATDTVWAHRDALFNIDSTSSWTDSNPDVDAQNIASNRSYWEQIEPMLGGGFYVNSLMDENQGQINSNYRQNHERLVKVKNTYDPSNFFRLNANVQPTK